MFGAEKPKRTNKNMNSTNSGATTSTKSKIPMEENQEEEIWRNFQAREEEIERKKMAVKDKIQQRLGFAEEATRSLTQTLEGLEIMGDPMRKEVGMVRKKIEMANREIKSLSQSCQKKVSYNQSLLTILLLFTSTTLLYPSILTPDDK